jgi:hypothetical protein
MEFCSFGMQASINDGPDIFPDFLQTDDLG